MDDGKSNNSEPTLDARVAVVQNDVTHLVRRVGRVESSVKETRDGLKSDMRGAPDDVRLQSLLDDLKEMFRDLKSDNAALRLEMRELRHNRRVLYALCGAVIVSMIALLAEGVVY